MAAFAGSWFCSVNVACMGFDRNQNTSGEASHAISQGCALEIQCNRYSEKFAPRANMRILALDLRGLTVSGGDLYRSVADRDSCHEAGDWHIP